MKKLIYLLTFIIMISIVSGATYYVKNPVDCPTTDATNYPGQDCSPNDICGDISSIAQCSNTSLISIPSLYNGGYQTQVNSALNPGYVLDCYASTTCVDKWYCDYNTTCYSTYFRSTVCNSTTVHSCGACRSGYNDCDGDGLTCEILNGAACTVGGVSGTYSGCSGAIGNCVVTKSYFQTGTLASYLTQATERAMLWFKNYDATGWLINATNSINETWGINNNSCMILKDGTSVCDATDLGSSVGVSNDTIYNIYNITKEPTGFPEQGVFSSTLNFDSATRNFTINSSTTFDFYCKGTKFTRTSDSILIANVAGYTNYIYYDCDGILRNSTTAWGGDFFNVVQVATVFYNGSVGLLGKERHGLSMDGATHYWMHTTVGTRYVGGFTLVANIANIWNMTGGTIADEDNIDINPIQNTSHIFFHTATGRYTFSDSTTHLYYNISNILQYDTLTGTSDVSNNEYVAYWLVESVDRDNPTYIIMGQRIDNTLQNAINNNKWESLDLGALDIPEFKVLYRVILRRNGAGVPTVSNILDMRSVSNLPSGTYTATSHNILTNLDYDSSGHTGFASSADVNKSWNETRGNAIYYPIDSNPHGYLNSSYNASYLTAEQDLLAIGLMQGNNSAWSSTYNSSYLTAEQDLLAIGLMQGNNSAWSSTYNSSYLTAEQDLLAIGLMQGNNSAWSSTYNSSYLTAEQDLLAIGLMQGNETERVNNDTLLQDNIDTEEQYRIDNDTQINIDWQQNATDQLSLINNKVENTNDWVINYTGKSWNFGYWDLIGINRINATEINYVSTLANGSLCIVDAAYPAIGCRWNISYEGQIIGKDNAGTAKFKVDATTGNMNITGEISTSNITVRSGASNSKVTTWKANDLSDMATMEETAGGAGYFTIRDANGANRIVLRGDGGNNVFDSASNLSLGMPTAPFRLTVNGSINATINITGSAYCIGASCITSWNNINGTGNTTAQMITAVTNVILNNLSAAYANDTWGNSKFNSTSWSKSGGNVILSTSTDLVGIGTIGPKARVQIDSGGDSLSGVTWTQLILNRTGAVSDAWGAGITLLAYQGKGFIVGGGGYGGDFSTYNGTATRQRMIISASTGNVGIDLAVPNEKLTVNSTFGVGMSDTQYGTASIYGHSDGTSGILNLYNGATYDDGADYWQLRGYTASGDFYISRNNTQDGPFRISATNNKVIIMNQLGIGTSAPDYNLTVNGTGVNITNSSQTAKLCLNGICSTSIESGTVTSVATGEGLTGGTITTTGTLRINGNTSERINWTQARSQAVLTGGGTIAWNTTSQNLSWSVRFIWIPVDKNLNTQGYVQLNPASWVLSDWNAIYANCTRDSITCTVDVRYYNDAAEDTDTWFLLATRNADSGKIIFANGDSMDDTITTTMQGSEYNQGGSPTLKNLNIAPADNNGILFWQSSTYSIYMDGSPVSTVGGVSGYSIVNQMSDTDGRGFTWTNGNEVGMSLESYTNNWDLTVANDITSVSGVVSVGTTTNSQGVGSINMTGNMTVQNIIKSNTGNVIVMIGN